MLNRTPKRIAQLKLYSQTNMLNRKTSEFEEKERKKEKKHTSAWFHYLR